VLAFWQEAGEAMFPATTVWFRARNLAAGQGRTQKPLPPEAVVYLLVTLAVHPDELPVWAVELLATRYLAHCTGTGSV
jgi:hypothetical protein